MIDEPEIDLNESDEEFEANLTEKIDKVRLKRRANGSTRQDDDVEKDVLRAKRKSKKANHTARIAVQEMSENLCQAFEGFLSKKRTKKESA